MEMENVKEILANAEARKQCIDSVSKFDKLDDMQISNTEVAFRKMDSTPAYVASTSSGYQIVISDNYMPSVSETTIAYQGLLLHELGHIYYNHHDLFINKDAHNRVLAKLKSMTDIKEPADLAPQYTAKLMNIACDMEINSKLFNPNEYVALIDQLNEHLKERGAISCFYDTIKQDIIEGIHPDYKQYPRGLSHKEYLDLLLDEIELDQTQTLVGSELYRTIGMGDRDKSGVEQVSGDLVQQIIDNTNNMIGDNGEASTELQEQTELLREIMVMFKRIQKQYNKDQLYNYNRGKQQDIMLNKYRKQYKSVFTENIFLVDISGSMDKQLLSNIINTIIQCKTSNKNRLVLFNTNIVNDRYITSCDPNKIKIGGGTNLWNALTQLKVEPNNHVIIISDFETRNMHDIEEWCKQHSVTAIDVGHGEYSTNLNPIKLRKD